MSKQPLAEINEWDNEACILSHSMEYMNDADERARERLIFTLVHRYFPTGSFEPHRLSSSIPHNPNEV